GHREDTRLIRPEVQRRCGVLASSVVIGVRIRGEMLLVWRSGEEGTFSARIVEVLTPYSDGKGRIRGVDRHWLARRLRQRRWRCRFGWWRRGQRLGIIHELVTNMDGIREILREVHAHGLRLGLGKGSDRDGIAVLVKQQGEVVTCDPGPAIVTPATPPGVDDLVATLPCGSVRVVRLELDELHLMPAGERAAHIEKV